MLRKWMVTAVTAIAATGCAHHHHSPKPAEPAPPAAAPAERDLVRETEQLDFCRQQHPVRAYRRTENLSEDLWMMFEIARLPKTKKGKTETRRFYDFACGISGPTYFVKCYYELTPGGKTVEFREPQDVLSRIRDLLFEYPIANGESGAQTRYLTCQKEPGQPATCDIAVQLDYVGP